MTESSTNTKLWDNWCVLMEKQLCDIPEWLSNMSPEERFRRFGEKDLKLNESKESREWCPNCGAELDYLFRYWSCEDCDYCLDII